jgi:hypothetical protein
MTDPVTANLEKGADSATVVSSAIASGGLIGAGLAILALQLPANWQAIGLAIVPTLSSACALAVRVCATEIRKRYSRKQWLMDRDNVLKYVDLAIPAAQKALKGIEDSEAKAILEEGIARMQRIKALAISAYPHERPWLSELRYIADQNPPEQIAEQASRPSLSQEG